MVPTPRAQAVPRPRPRDHSEVPPMKPPRDRPAARVTVDDARAATEPGLLVPTWSGDRAAGRDYAARRLAGDPGGLEPADFGVVWANMRRGHRVGELRALPLLADAFEDWLAESRLQAGIGGDPGPAR
ncbi:hypothetical protein [Saccharothrix sp. HUAS TT1]|uniref:hypothetical protein n=1 Tax=unclassified Saccharothrix TaxID=2593673 RepID=UPI00345BE1B9